MKFPSYHNCINPFTFSFRYGKGFWASKSFTLIIIFEGIFLSPISFLGVQDVKVKSCEHIYLPMYIIRNRRDVTHYIHFQ